MVLPLVDEDNPKCFLCHKTLKNFDELQKHQETDHKDFLDFHKKQQERQPVPGDITIF